MKGVKIKKRNIKIIAFIIIIGFLIWLFIPVDESTTFSFVYGENGEPINEGELFFDNASFGFLEDGNITIHKLELYPLIITLKGKHNNQFFEIDYDFPNNYLDYSFVPFEVSQENIDNYLKTKRDEEVYGQLIEEDMFNLVEEIHWTHMPIKYYMNHSGFGKHTEEYREGVVERHVDAMRRLNNAVPQITFIETQNPSEADIQFYIKLDYRQFHDETGEEATIGYALPEINKNYITSAIISIAGGEGVCPNSNTALHELLHAFGLGHSKNDFGDLMSPSVVVCKPVQRIEIENIRCLKYIYSNGAIESCSQAIFTNYEKLTECEEGWFIAEGEEYCCPEPNMIIDEEGYCAYNNYTERESELGKSFDTFEDFEEAYDVVVTLKNEKGVGIAEIDLTTSFIDKKTEEEKNDFIWSNLEWSFIKLSENIETENYKVIYIRTSGEYIFNYEYMTPKWNIKNVYTPEFFGNLEIGVT